MKSIENCFDYTNWDENKKTCKECPLNLIKEILEDLNGLKYEEKVLDDWGEVIDVKVNIEEINKIKEKLKKRLRKMAQKKKSKMILPAMLSIDEEYPISYDFDLTENIDFLKKLKKENE